MRGFPKNPIGLFAAAILLAAAFFALDLALPLGVAGGVPYVALVLLGWWLDRPRYLVLLGAIATALTIAGYYFSPAGGIEWVVLTNRALAFFAIWTTVGLLAKAKTSENALQDAHHEVTRQADALRESEARFRSLYHKTPVMMHSIGTDGRLISVSDFWLQVLGYERDQVIGRRAVDFLTEESRRRALDEVLPELYRTGSSKDVPYRFATKGGEIIDVLLSAVMDRDAAGEGRRSLTVLIDVTERRRADEQIRKLNEHLEERVEERTAELRAAQDALLRKERLAALGQLTGTVAHELRNPLGTIANAINVMRHKCSASKPGLEKTLVRAERSIARCETIITELLDFTRAKGLQPEPTVVDAWLAGVLEEQHIPEAVTVTCDFQADAAAVAFDRDELRRAVINLVDNACQAMTGGDMRADAGGPDAGAGGAETGGAETGGELALSTRMNGKRVEIVVTDSGPGIPAAVLPQVLEPLFSTKTFGTGLGLPTVQRIMEAHGGGLEITSREQYGTKVVLWLPLDQPLEAGASA